MNDQPNKINTKKQSPQLKCSNLKKSASYIDTSSVMRDLTNIEKRSASKKKPSNITSNLRQRAHLISSHDQYIDDLATNILESSAQSKKSEYNYDLDDLYPANNFKSLRRESSKHSNRVVTSENTGNTRDSLTPKSFLGYKNVTERVSNAIRHKSRSVVELN